MTATRFRVDQATDGVEDIGTASGSYMRPQLEADKLPSFRIKVPDPSGINAHMLAIGKRVDIRRNGRLEMRGIVDVSIPEASSEGRMLSVEGVSEGYRLLQARQCDSYDYDEDADPATTRDAVTFNPWHFYVLRKAGGTISPVTFLEPAVDGIEFEEAAEALAGTKAVIQLDFQDNGLFRHSTVYGAVPSLSQAYLDGKSGDLRPKLQRLRGADGAFVVGNNAVVPRTIRLMNGDPNIDAMGTPVGIMALVVYEQGDANDQFDVQVSAMDDGTYTDLITRTQSAIADFRGTGLSAKMSAVSLNASGDGHVSFQFTPHNSTGGAIANATKIHYLKAILYTESDTGLAFRRRLPDNIVASTVGGGVYAIGAGAAQTRMSAAFRVDATTAVTVNRAQLRVRKIGAPAGTATLRLSTSRASGGVTAAIDVATTIIADPDVNTPFPLLDVAIPSMVLSPGTTYFLTLEYTGGDASNRIEVFSGTVPGSSINASATYQGDALAVPFLATAGDIPLAYRLYLQPADVEDAFVEIDLQGSDRLASLERIRKLSLSDTVLNSSPSYDAWIDEDLVLNWVERRGNDIAGRTYSFGAGNLRELRHEFFGKDIAYQTIAFGAGSGDAQTRIVSRADFLTGGGLYDATRDPAVGALYGSVAGIRKFVDPGERSLATLLRRARADHKLHRDPVETIEVEIIAEAIPFFDVGDSILLADVQTRTNGLQKVAELERSWSGGDREKMRVRLGETPTSNPDYIAQNAEKANLLALKSQPKLIKSGSTPGIVFFDKTSHGVFSFNIDEGLDVQTVKLQITTQPYSVPNTTGAISTFKGNAPGANPVYGSKVQFAVDPTLGANGLPTAFAAQAHPAYITDQAAPQTIEVDVTGYLAVGANGAIRTGLHQIYLLTAADTNNTNGLACTALVVKVAFREG